MYFVNFIAFALTQNVLHLPLYMPFFFIPSSVFGWTGIGFLSKFRQLFS